MTDHVPPEISNIIILDTHPVARMGLASLLANSFDNAKLIEAGNVAELTDFNAHALPQLFILVINTDFGDDGSNPVSEVRTHYPQASIILYGEGIKPELVISYLKSGVNGYLSKHKDLSELIKCINTVSVGKRYVSAEHMELLFEHLLQNHKTIKNQDLLTPRQNEVANYLVEGLSTSAIAEKTGLHISTVSTFKAAIFAKLGIDNIFKLKQLMEADK